MDEILWKKTLLRDILMEKDLSIGSTFVQERLSRTKVLIVFDDVSDSRQIYHLAGGYVQYGRGSRIIITSRNRSVLKKTVEDDKIYKVGGLKPDDALQLFHLHAFKDSCPSSEYAELSAGVVDHAGGIPLALQILGSSFLPCESKEEWEDMFNKLKKFPSKEIQNAFRLSYDRLEIHEQEVFLDISCFYKGKSTEYVKTMLGIRGFFAVAGIRVLIDKSLISIDSTRETIEMHDLLQEMGWAIVREQCDEEPGKRKRLFNAKDVYRVLKNNTGTSAVEAVFFNISEIEEQHLNRADFKKMNQLKLLNVDNSSFGQLNFSLDLPNSLCYLYWCGFPFKSLPSKFSSENLVELRMPHILVDQLWKKGQNLMSLKVLDLSYSCNLTEIPNLSRCLKIEYINLFDCISLVEIPSYFQFLDKLTYVQLGCCTSLNYLPEMPGNIKFLNLQRSGIKELPSSVWSNERISEFNIGNCKDLEKLPSSTCNLKVSGTFSLDHCSSLGEFSELPKDINVLDLTWTSTKLLPISSMVHLFSLTTVKLKDCQKLESLPIDICKLKSLKELDLTGCSKFEYFPVILDPMEHLEFLSLEETAIKELHSSIEFLPVLKTFQLKGCKRLESLPTSIYKLKCLEGLDLSGCSRFEYFPEILEPMERLEFLCFKGTLVKKLPCSIDNLTGLQTLDLNLCGNFEVVPSSIYNLKNLVTLNFYACQELKELPSGTVNLISLEVLNLSRSGISEIPDGLICSASLKDVNLSETLIRSIPACIKEAPCLSRLWLTNCKMLQSLPALPVLVYLEAEGCTSLKTVSSSWTTLTQGWDKFCQEIINFFDCINLEHNARSNIMADAQLRILRVASASRKLREETYDENSSRPLVTIVCPGHEIPNWFSNQNDGSSIIINLPPNWFCNGFLGFALSVVVTYNDCRVRHGVEFGCKYKFITKNGESHEMISCPFYLGWYDSSFNPHHVFMTYNAFELEEDAKYSTGFYKLVTEASVHFWPMSLSCQPTSYLKVEKCGISLLYAEDAEKLKLMS